MYVRNFFLQMVRGHMTFLPFFPDGGIDRFAKVRSFSSSMTDIDGDRAEESEMSDEGTN